MAPLPPDGLRPSLPPSRPVRIGIAGPSCSGKSTVAALLAARLGAARFCLDDLYLRDHPRRHVEVAGESVRSYDHPGAYDGPGLLRLIEAGRGPVVAEGFLLFAYPQLRAAFDVRVFVGLPWAEIRRRRAARTGQSPPKVEASFERVGESEWAAFGAVQAGLPGMLVLDGAEAPEALADRIADEVARAGGMAACA